MSAEAIIAASPEICDDDAVEGTCFGLWKYYGNGRQSPFSVATGKSSHERWRYVVMDTNGSLCLICSKEEAKIIVDDWNKNEALYTMIVDTPAEQEMLHKTI